MTRELAKKIERCEKKVLRGVLDRVIFCDMPNQRAADKETLSFFVPRTLGYRIRKEAKRRRATATDVVVAELTRATSHVELTPEDYEEIARATRAAKHQNRQRAKN